MRRLLLLLPVTVALLAGCVAPPGAPAAPNTPPGPTAPSWATEMLARINSERATAGRAPVTLCTTLMTAAQRHSDDQAANSRMSHTGSNGSTLSQRAEAAGYRNWTGLAENVAAGQSTVTIVMNAWMGSTGHRNNLLSATYQHVGLGRAPSGSGSLYWTQKFGRSGSC